MLNSVQKNKDLFHWQSGRARARSGPGPQRDEGFIPEENLNARHNIWGIPPALEPKAL